MKHDRARVIDVYSAPDGYRPPDIVSGQDQLLAHLVNVTADLQDPSDVLLIGQDDDCVGFVHQYKGQFDDRDAELSKNGVERFHLALNKPGSDGLGPVCLWLASEIETRGYIQLIRSGRLASDDENARPRRINTVIILWPSDENYDRYLPLLLESCPDVQVYFVWSLDSEDIKKNGLIPRIEIPGYDGLVPTNVDFDAEPEVDEPIGILPENAMYGKLADNARSLRAPRGFAYLASLAMAAPYVKPTASVRPTVYVALLGNVHTGKSVAIDRAGMLYGLLDDAGDPTGSMCKSHTPASDRGLINMFRGPELEPCVLALDEGRILMSKGSIENSTLVSTLCQLWSKNTAGISDKKTTDKCYVRLSIVANIKIKDDTEFSKVFTHSTAHGLFDRFLYAVRGEEDWHFQPWHFDSINDARVPDVSEPRFTQESFELIHAWRDDAAERGSRDRLAENAARVALITSAVNGDAIVTTESIQAALRLVEWQEQIRTVYQPAKGANEMEECVAEIEDTFRNAPGYALNWREVSLRKNWHRKFPRTLKQAKTLLETMKVLVHDKKSKKHYLIQKEKQQ